MGSRVDNPMYRPEGDPVGCQRHVDVLRRLDRLEDAGSGTCARLTRVEITLARYGVVPAILSAIMGAAALLVTLWTKLQGGVP